MIVSRTPLRISLAGGGSDIPAFYEAETGAVVSASIDKYIYVTVNPKFDRKIRASYSVTEIVDSIDELKHELIREALRLVGLDGGIEITSIADIPSEGTGLGSSSSYTVGLLNALHAYVGRHAGAERLAREACEIELNRCRKPIGKQDQYIAAYGGIRYFEFAPDGEVSTDPVIFSAATRVELQSRLLLMYTGLTRSADDILAEQQANVLIRQDTRADVRSLVHLARELRDSLRRNDLDRIGGVLHDGWSAKRKLAPGISNVRIDEWYEAARSHGALGGKVLGAGGGGFLLLYAPSEKHREIAEALPELRPVRFSFEPQGSKIIYVEE